MEVLTKKICNQIFQRLYYLISILAKPTALPEKFGTLEKTLFDNLVPVVVHQALAAFDARKKDIINREITRLKEATNLVNAAMASMNLPAAIESTGTYILYIDVIIQVVDRTFFLSVSKNSTNCPYKVCNNMSHSSVLTNFNRNFKKKSGVLI